MHPLLSCIQNEFVDLPIHLWIRTLLLLALWRVFNANSQERRWIEAVKPRRCPSEWIQCIGMRLHQQRNCLKVFGMEIFHDHIKSATHIENARIIWYWPSYKWCWPQRSIIIKIVFLVGIGGRGNTDVSSSIVVILWQSVPIFKDIEDIEIPDIHTFSSGLCFVSC